MNQKKLILKKIENKIDDLYDDVMERVHDNTDMMEIHKEGFEFIYEKYKNKRLWNIAQSDALMRVKIYLENLDKHKE
tara:strand:- start:925 stop:1155 length:231 start_codon:yes stop_codon:yes gene_type:complete